MAEEVEPHILKKY